MENVANFTGVEFVDQFIDGVYNNALISDAVQQAIVGALLKADHQYKEWKKMRHGP